MWRRCWLSRSPGRRASGGRAVAVGLGAAAKFATLALAPLFARRAPMIFAGALALTLAVTVLPFVPDGGLRELYDRTVGYQAGRPSPFSIWGQVDSLGWLQTIVKAAAVGLALLVAVVPCRPGLPQTAALGAAVLIAVQLTASYWFYLYVVWFVPFLLVALMAAHSPCRARQGRPPTAPPASSYPLDGRTRDAASLRRRTAPRADSRASLRRRNVRLQVGRQVTDRAGAEASGRAGRLYPELSAQGTSSC